MVWEEPQGPPIIHHEQVLQGPREDKNKDNIKQDDVATLDECLIEVSPRLADCLLEYPVFDEQNNLKHPFHFKTLRYYQREAAAVTQLPTQNPDLYKIQQFGGVDLVCYIRGIRRNPKSYYP